MLLSVEAKADAKDGLWRKAVIHHCDNIG